MNIYYKILHNTMTMKILLTYESKVNHATSKSKSLRVGFPKEISEILEANAGDVVRWHVNLMDDMIVITIEKK